MLFRSGSAGYPKGKAYGTVPEGLVLRPAIPNDELFTGDGTYGPKANFKIALRELQGCNQPGDASTNHHHAMLVQRASQMIVLSIDLAARVAGNEQTWIRRRTGASMQR